MARKEYLTKILAEYPWQEQTGSITFRNRTTCVLFWARLSEETEEYYDNGRKTRVVDHISVEFFDSDTPTKINGIPVRGGYRFMRRESDGALFFRGYMTAERCREDGGTLLGAGDALPDATRKAVREGLENVAARLFNDHAWLTRERMTIRRQEMERASSDVEKAREELDKAEVTHAETVARFIKAEEMVRRLA